jgi:hypothetical protein
LTHFSDIPAIRYEVVIFVHSQTLCTMKKTLNLTLLLSLIYTIPILSQEYLGNNTAFFEKKSALYQRWLDAKGMGEMMKVDRFNLAKNDTELELYLSLRTTSHDEAIAMWKALNESYREKNQGSDFGAALFETFVRMMEIPPAQGNIRIYLPLENSTGYNPCFYVWFWEKDGSVVSKEGLNECKAQPIEVIVKKPPVKKLTGSAETQVTSRDNAKVTFEKILQFARKHYKVKRCEERNPDVVDTVMRDYSLTFTVTDLCREVLKDEEKSAWCDFVERWWGPCNDMRRERLEFSFTYISTEDGYLLSGSLTGKFGSGVYVPRKSGYMDMEPDFAEDYLIPYVTNFQEKLRLYLEQADKK